VRRFVYVVFLVILVAIVFGNAREISRMKKEIADLQTQVAALQAHKGKPSEAADSSAVISKAGKHAAMAKEYLAKGDFKRARKELDESLRLMQRAGQDTGSSYKDRIEKAQKTLEDTRSLVDRMLKKFEKQPDKAKGG